MWNVLKYGTWNVSQPRMDAVNALVSGGYAPLAAMILAARGLTTPKLADTYLDCSCELLDPFLMTDMALAAGRVGLAMTRGEKIAVFGDYDVDGVTATCLLTDFLRKNGADCVPYIPGRLEEGYGLNPIALHVLAEQGVKLIVTVDCGITAIAEAQLCKELGMDLVITDHHECKDQLPEACAIVDPHRPDGGYPHKTLSGVGVAFKLAAALSGDQEQVLQEYADMVCLGTVADVMPLQGENRVFVTRGLELLRKELQAMGKMDKIIEIGAVKVVNGQITDKFSTFVNPKVPIPFEITQLTSITDQMVLDAPTIEKALPDFTRKKVSQ